MKSSREPTYKIEQTEEFIRQFTEIASRYGRLPEFHKSIVWNLERSPHQFSQVAHEFYMVNSTELEENSQFPDAKIVYRIIETENRVILLAIEEV